MRSVTVTLKKIVFSFLFLSAFTGTAKAQNVIDQVVAVVGGDMILQSDIEGEIMRMKMQGYISKGDIKCEIFENLLIQKMLLNQAKIDSLTVNDVATETEIDRRLKYFINQIGSEKALENYFRKPIYEIREDLKETIREQQLTQQMQQKIVENASVTPSEVKHFFKSIPSDSLPMIPEQYEICQLLLYPPSKTEAKYQVKERLLELRERILKGERFSTLAVAYSEDHASAKRGGELGFRTREELVKSFADVAFNLKEGQVSQIVETEYGYHIIQMIEKRENQVNVRHILLKPQFSIDMLVEAQSKLDSIVNLIKADSMTFDMACAKFSEDKKSNLNGGLVVNPQNNTSLFEKEHIQPADFYVIKDLKVGEISSPFESRDDNANVAFKVIKLKSKIPSHKANLKDDYNVIQNIAKNGKEKELLDKWISEKQKTMYIKIDQSFKGCSFSNEGWFK